MTNDNHDVYSHKPGSSPESHETTMSQLARNHYFTGKLLVERDFADEQRYMLTKHLRHNRGLHGFGCVAGLRVKQHPEPALRNSHILIEPGVALDCLGHEIVVMHEVNLNYKKLLAETTDCLSDEDDTEHTLQIRLHHKEYYAEQIPAFFDEHGDGTTSQPNRVVESYSFSVLIDPVMKHHAPHERRCEDLLTSTLDNLPACPDDYEGVILATITGYTFGGPITDRHIDNLTYRHILPSTDLLTDMIRCILADGGGKGRQGERGPAGRNGLGIDDVQAITVDCDSTGSATLENIDGRRTLILEIPRGCDAPGSTSREYTRICGLNWEHRGSISREELEENGLLIAFSRKVRARDINRHTFQVLSSVTDGGFITWHQLVPRVVKGIEYARGVQLEVEEGEDGICIIQSIGGTHGHLVNGAQFRFARLPVGPLTLRVVLHGDQIQDEYALGVDANHLPPWLPQRPTGDGIEGGIFESWFTVEDIES